MRILVIDGQGGKLGALLVEQLRQRLPEAEVIAVGSNSIATSAMLRAGAQSGATGENPVVHLSPSTDLIMGPSGIIMANSLLGEITPAMAVAVGSAKAMKILIPLNKCCHHFVGVQELSMSESVRLAVDAAVKFAQEPQHFCP